MCHLPAVPHQWRCSDTVCPGALDPGSAGQGEWAAVLATAADGDRQGVRRGVRLRLRLRFGGVLHRAGQCPPHRGAHGCLCQLCREG